MKSILLPVLLAVAAIPAHAQALSGRVVGVADGDTLTVLDANRAQHKIRLSDIDAPEKAQAFGQRSKQSLSDLCFGKSAEVRIRDTDRYGRSIGRVTCQGVDANAIQVKRGMAWVYDAYVSDKRLYALQAQAKQQHLGLWADPSPVQPWAYRKAKRH